MGLQVWLPLNGNLNNQGLSNVTTTNNGATVDNNGKIGKCYSFNGSNSWILGAFSSAKTSAIGSLCCWVKFNSFPASNSWMTIMKVCEQGGFAQTLFGISMQYANQIAVCVKGSGSNIYTHSLSTNVWYHLCATYDGTVVKLYINGNLVLSKNASTSSVTSASKLHIGGSTGNYILNGYMNDLRYYDNVLSEQEVKEISKGLILHYPLNRNGWGQNNLITDTNFTSSFISSMAVSNAVNLGQWKRETSNVTLAMDGKYVKLHYETNTSRYGIHYEISLDPGTYTYSITAGGRMTCSFGLATSWPSTNIITANSPGRYSKTFTVSETATYRMYIYTTSANPNIWFNWPKLEVGDKSTPWAPNSADVLYTTMGISDVIEYDISGYQNNGTRNGLFVWVDDTPKYSLSANFTGTQYILSDSPSANGATLSAWVKTTSTSNQALVIDYKSGLGIGFWSSVIVPSCNSSIKTTYQISNYHANQWNHIVVVKNTSSSILCYVNGQLQSATATNDYWSTGVIDGLSIASRPNGASPATCKISDVRIYATALSADDIKFLYESNKL